MFDGSLLASALGVVGPSALADSRHDTGPRLACQTGPDLFEAWRDRVDNDEIARARKLDQKLKDEARWLAESGIGRDGALLVRPDQHVAWRAASLPEAPDVALRDALTRIVGPRASSANATAQEEA